MTPRETPQKPLRKTPFKSQSSPGKVLEPATFELQGPRRSSRNSKVPESPVMECENLDGSYVETMPQNRSFDADEGNTLMEDLNEEDLSVEEKDGFDELGIDSGMFTRNMSLLEKKSPTKNRVSTRNMTQDENASPNAFLSQKSPLLAPPSDFLPRKSPRVSKPPARFSCEVNNNTPRPKTKKTPSSSKSEKAMSLASKGNTPQQRAAGERESKRFMLRPSRLNV